MKLSLIHSLSRPTNHIGEGAFGRLTKGMGPITSRMPQKKQEHSHRVGRRLHRAGAHPEAVIAGLAHDYLERGGDLESLQNHIADMGFPPRVVLIVRSLTSDEKNRNDQDDDPSNPPLDHLRAALLEPDVMEDDDAKNCILLVKMSDRLDNLIRRIKRDGGLVDEYRKKSADIVMLARNNYTGPTKQFNKIYSKLRKVLNGAKRLKKRRTVAMGSLPKAI